MDVSPGFLDLNEMRYLIAHDIAMRAPNPFDTPDSESWESLLYVLIREDDPFILEEIRGFKVASRTWDITHGWKVCDVFYGGEKGDRLVLVHRPIEIADLVK